MAWEIASADQHCLKVADVDLVWRMASRSGFAAFAPVLVCWELRGHFYPVTGTYGEDEIVLRTAWSEQELTVAELIKALGLQSDRGNPLYAEIPGEESLYGVRRVAAADGQLLLSVYAGDEILLDD